MKPKILHIAYIYANVSPMEKQIKTAKKDAKTESQKVYEVGYLLSSGIPEEKLADEVNTIKSLIEKNGGTFISDEFPKIRQLAYVIPKTIGTTKQKFTHAYFGWVKFEAESVGLPVIKEGLEKNDNIVRFLLIKTVRENTMSSIKPPLIVRKDGKGSEDKQSSVKEKEEPKTHVSEEELDKSIDELVIE